LVLDDPRNIPYLLVWQSEREIKETVRVSRYSEPGSSDWTGWVEIRRGDGTHTLVQVLERALPRNSGKTPLLLCPECRKPRRALYGWVPGGRYTTSVYRSPWKCRRCAGLRYASEGRALLIRGGMLSRLLRLPFPDVPSPRPEPWFPYVFTSPREAAGAGVFLLT